MSREGQLAKNTLIIAFGTFLPKFLSVISLPIITAGLTKAEYGTFDLFNILESLFLPCITLQIHTAAFRFLIDCKNDDSKRKTIISNVICFTLVTSLIAVLVLFIALRSISNSTKLLICLFFFFDILRNNEQQIMRGLHLNKLYSMSAIINSAVNVMFIFIFVKIIPLGLNGAVIALLLASLGADFFLFLKGKLYKYFSPFLFSRETLGDLLKYSWPMIPNSLSLWAMNLSDRLVLTMFMGVEVNAVYAVANKMPSLFNTVQSTFTLAWQENASIASADADSGDYYGQMFDLVFNMMVGVMALLIACTPFLFELLIRGDYDDAYIQMPILFMGVFFNCIVAFLGGIYVAHKKTKSVGITTTIAAGINLVIDLCFVRIIGIYAASISTLVSYMFLAIYRMNDVKNFEKMNFKRLKITCLIIVLCMMCVICFQRDIYLNILNFILAVLLAVFLNYKVIKHMLKMVFCKMKKH